jgi:uncharacterized protein YhfF
MNFELTKTQSAEFLQQAGVSSDADFEVRQIGTDAAMVELILSRIRIGEKTMTFSLPWIAERTGYTKLVPGRYMLIVDAEGQPCMLLKTERVKDVIFGEIDDSDLSREGMQMRTVEAWKPLHTTVWNFKLEPLGLSVTEDMPVWREYFEMVYPEIEAPN